MYKRERETVKTTFIYNYFCVGEFIICIPKAEPGEWFEGLDMLTKLLAPSSSGKKTTKQPLIQVIGVYTPKPITCTLFHYHQKKN